MSIKVNCNGENEHKFNQVCAFIDDEHDFYLVDESHERVIRLKDEGYDMYNCEPYESVEDFLNVEFSCRVLRVFQHGRDYEIIVNG